MAKVTLLIVSLVSCVCFALAVKPVPIDPNNTRGYRYIMGTAVEECPEGTHSYGSTGQRPTWSQRTCTSPEPYDMGPICDLSRCDCDEPTVLDETTDKCVLLEDCPDSAPPAPPADTSRCQRSF